MARRPRSEVRKRRVQARPRQSAGSLLLSTRHGRRILRANEERELARLAAAGNAEAREALIEANLRLVAALARRYQGLGLPVADLVQEGTVGLIQAVDRFDWRRGSRFSTYAAWWIRQAIQRALTSDSRTIRLPHRVVAKQLAARRATASLEATLGRAATAAEIAEATGLDPAAVDFASHPPLAAVSLNETVGSDEGSTQLVDLVADATAQDPLLAAEERARIAALRTALAHLSPRERRVLGEHFGLDCSPHTLDAIAHELHLAPERVRQIEQHALSTLARRLDER